jgi:hypothetical protein
MNASMGVRFSEIGGKVDAVQGSVNVLNARLGDVESKVDNQGSRLASLEEKVASLESGPRSAPPPTDDSGASSSQFPPKGQRRTVVFCFWPKDTPRDDIVKDLETFVPDHELVENDGFFAPARFCNKGKIRFKTVSRMWVWIKQHKGQKFMGGEVWWAIDKPLEERNEAKKVGLAIQVLKDYVVAREGAQSEDALKARVPADWDNCFVMLKSSPDARAVRILEKPRGEVLWTKADDSPDLVGFDWVASLAKINAGA